MFEFPVDTSSIVYSPESGYQHNPVRLDTAYRRGDFITAVVVTGIAIAILAPGLNQILQNSVGVLVRGGQAKSQIANTADSTQLSTQLAANNQQATQQTPTVSSGSKTPPKFTGSWAGTPRRGQNIAGFPVTSAYGPRSSPCTGCSSMHLGADIGVPMYTPLYAIGPSGSSVNVRCWDNGRWGWVASYSVTEWGVSFDYVHLPVGECKSGLQKVGTVIAKSGTAGTGPHLHFQQRPGGAVAEIYKQDYFAPGGCAELSQPAFEVCADIAINSGVGRSRQYLREIGIRADPKQLARALNERHRQDYLKWSAPGNKDAVFRAGWLSRADRRDKYIDKF